MWGPAAAGCGQVMLPASGMLEVVAELLARVNSVRRRADSTLTLQATRRSGSTLEVAVVMGPAAGAALAAAEVAAEAPAAEEPPRGGVVMAQRSVQRRSLSRGHVRQPATGSPAGLLPLSFAPKGRRSTVALASAAAAARAPDASAPQPGLLPAVPSPPAAVDPAPPPAAASWRQGSEPPLLSPPLQMPGGLHLLPQNMLGALLAVPEPPSPTAAKQSRPCGFGRATPPAVGPLPPPGHAWSAVQSVEALQQPPASAQHHMDMPPPQRQQQQEEACMQLPEQQPPSARSCSAAADWHAELLQMPLDWDGRLLEDAPGAAGLPMPPLQGGAASPPSPQGGRVAETGEHELAGLQLPGAHDPLDEALLPPPPPLDVERQLAAAAAQFPAVAAAAAAAWGLQWPPPQVQQVGGDAAQTLRPQKPPEQEQGGTPQPALPDASACIERSAKPINSSASLLHF